jgi:molybdenum cofactor cytidylyltransferase
VTPPTAPLVGLLLAAGRGTRFGGDKLMHPLDGGTPMALACARKLRPCCDRVVAVVSAVASGEALARCLRDEGIEVVPSADAAFGMGHSLADGVRATGGAGGWLVALGDMPFIDPSTYERVAVALRGGASIAVPAWRGRTGHPVGFDRCWRMQLGALTGDAGARALLAAVPGEVHRCEVDDPGIRRDVDTAADLAAGNAPARLSDRASSAG